MSTGVTPVRWRTRQWILLFLFSGAIMLDGLENSMIAVAIPRIQAAFGVGAATAQWVPGAYILAFGAFLLLGGRCADLFGRKRVFVVGMAVFALVSVLGALADDVLLIIATRFVKGVAAGFTAPAAMSLLATTFAEGPERNRAFGVFNVFEASGYSSGLLVGGLLAAIDWRTTFVLPAVVAVALMLGALKYLPPDPPRADRPRLDVGGAVTLLLGTLLLVFTVVSDLGLWLSLGGFALSAALLVAFALIERRVAAPLIRLAIFRDREILAANASSFLLYGGAMGFQFVLALYLQNLNGWEPWHMSFVLLPAGLVVVLVGPRIGWLIGRYGVNRVLMTGLLSFLPCYLLLLRLGPEPALWMVLVPVSVIWGLGFALSLAALMVTGTTGVPDTEQGLAAGLLNSSLQIGGAFGLAVVTATITPASTLGDLYPGIWVILGFATLTLAAQALRRPTR
ncbi:MFS transporter [Actinokineospora globicatena]|uniref:MFS transporter n=1 Tax=Actinokineospora globicatena TaxID=103729 RepID=UPI0024A27E4E|nr:MFS transporter [Actinokineospora globicatena]MCP2306183.1 putative arabinose efflux permease, MFS family [Actinokineospora globicatena]GLW79939.1 MFS transporter [Actinokineospora globicatena]GLW86768.1 MFS transporter [Actinokineospora globicatena]